MPAGTFDSGSVDKKQTRQKKPGHLMAGLVSFSMCGRHSRPYAYRFPMREIRSAVRFE